MSYFVTAIAYYPDIERYSEPWKVTRTFGHFSTQVEAELAVGENRCDMHEFLYNFIVVEELNYGIHPMGDQQTWFAWTDREFQWQKIDKPAWAKGVLNWSVG